MVLIDSATEVPISDIQKMYDPSMPEVLTRNCGQGEFKTAGARCIRKYFQEMSVNELGICEECQRVQGKL